MSCSASNTHTRSNGPPPKSLAEDTSKLTRSATPARSAAGGAAAAAGAGVSAPDPGALGGGSRGLDGVLVVVRSDELRGRERARHQDRRGAVSAADVGHSGAR